MEYVKRSHCCKVPGCQTQRRGTSFYNIPAVLRSDPELTGARRREWLKRLNLREDGSLKNYRVCANHFIAGKFCFFFHSLKYILCHHIKKNDNNLAFFCVGTPAYYRDTMNPDWAPCVNMPKNYHAETALKRYIRTKKRSTLKLGTLLFYAIILKFVEISLFEFDFFSQLNKLVHQNLVLS